jgi:hypothetical protein
MCFQGHISTTKENNTTAQHKRGLYKFRLGLANVRSTLLLLEHWRIMVGQLFNVYINLMDHLHYRLNFDLDKDFCLDQNLVYNANVH